MLPYFPGEIKVFKIDMNKSRDLTVV